MAKPLTFFCLFLLLLASVVPSCSAGEANCRIVLATGSPGGIYRPLGERLASIANTADDDLWITPLETDGSVENCLLLASGRAHAGFVMGPVLHQALEGTGPFAQSGPLKLEAVARLFSAPQHLVVREGSGITDLGKLKGHSVSIGMAGSGNRQIALKLLALAGISVNRDIRAFELPQDSASHALAAGTVDAAFFNIAPPAAAILDASAFHPIRIVPLSRQLIELAVNALPGTSPSVIPAGTYPGQERDVATVASDNYLVVPVGQDPHRTFRLASLVLENREGLARVLGCIAHRPPSSAFPLAFPLSPGARSYFLRHGIDGRP